MKYQRKRQEVEAVEWTGQNWGLEICDFFTDKERSSVVRVNCLEFGNLLLVETGLGFEAVKPGDMLFRGKHTFHVMRRLEFDELYEPVPKDE